MSGKMKFGEYLKWRRKSLGLSQWDLAEDLGVKQTTVSSWELEKTSPPFDFAKDIIESFGDSLEIITDSKDFQRSLARNNFIESAGAGEIRLAL